METQTVVGLLTNFWAELRNFKTNFNINYCVESLLFYAVLPANDILSDFLVADNLYNTDYHATIIDQLMGTQFCAMLMYFFIALPGFMVLIYNMGLYLDKFCFAELFYVVLVLIVCLVPALLLFFGDPRVVFYLALAISCCFQLLNFMSVIFHGPYMKKLVGKITEFEGKFESAPQLFLQLTLLYAGDEYTVVPAIERFYGIVTSLLMLSKDFAENILINTEEINFAKLSFANKLFFFGRIIPPIVLTVIFRLGALSLACYRLSVSQDFVLVIPLMLALVLTPTICLIIFKSSSSITCKLTVSECVFGAMGEMSSFSIWGELKQVESRWIQLLFIIYFNLVYSIFCLYEAFYPSNVNTDWYAMAFFFCGWTAFTMYMKQVFYLDKDEDEKEDSKDTGETNLNMVANEIPMEEFNNKQERKDCYIFDHNGRIIGELESVSLKGSTRVKRRRELIHIYNL